MRTLVFPVLVLEGHAGPALALTVEREPVSALGASPGAAVAQIREALGHQARHGRAYEGFSLFGSSPGGMTEPLVPPDIGEPELLELSIPVRPEYRRAKEVFASPHPVNVRVAVVSGVTRDGLLQAFLPLLEIAFRFGDRASLKGLVHHYVLAELKGLTPREITRHLSYRKAWLESVAVRSPAGKRPAPDARWRPPQLSAVADCLLDEASGSADPDGRHSPKAAAIPLAAASAAPSRAFEREADVASLREKLRSGHGSVLLVGETGVGKTTLLLDAVRGLPRTSGTKDAEVDSGDAEEGAGSDSSALAADRCWRTSAGRLIAGMKYLGQWEERCEAVVEELASGGGVLAVESLLELVRVGGGSPTASLGAFLAPYLAAGELRLVAEATPAELDACRRLLPSLANAFEVQRIAPLGERAAVSALERIAEPRVRSLPEGMEKGTTDLVFRLFRRFLPYDAFPGKTAAFFVDLCEEARRERAERLTRERALRLFVRRTGLPELFLRDDLPLALEDVAGALAKDVLGQPQACEAVARVVTAFKAGLNDPGRPLSVLLFAGPTGVGKTALARSLARTCFGQGEKRDRLVRLDMSEYGTPGSAARLLGELEETPPEWIRRVREQPFTLLLLDEIEKASDAVFDVLLGLLDEGRLTDRFGRLTRFGSAFVVMTTNLGATSKAAPGFSPTPPPSFEREAMSFFRPELFNRIDRVVTFAPLPRETILSITRKELEELSRREGLAGIRLTWTEPVVEHLARVGFDPLLGARPLQRALESEVVAPLARLLSRRRGSSPAAARLTHEGGAIGIELV